MLFNDRWKFYHKYNLEEAVKKMRGEPKTDITLTLVRKGEPKPIEVKITRDIIKVDSVKAKMIEDENILYIRVLI